MSKLGKSATRPVLVLDLDGTLVDSVHDLLATLNAIIARIDLPPVSIDTVSDAAGIGAKVMITRAFEFHRQHLTDELHNQLFEQFVEYYAAHIADHTLPFPGVGKALQQFSDEGWLLAVCTNKPEFLAKSLLHKLDMAAQFSAICGIDTFNVKKPDGRHILETIKQAGGDFTRSVMVGDTATDINAAIDAAIPAIAVDFGYSGKSVHTLGANRVISHFDELWQSVMEL
jgi:phosphoglycolate phosphatase